jgi:ribonuclease HI
MSNDPHTEGLHVFVDGTGGPTKIKEGVVARSGWGVAAYRDGVPVFEHCGFVTPQVTTNGAELHAFNNGLAYINRLLLQAPAVLWTDSRYVMDCVSNMAKYKAWDFRLANGDRMKNYDQILLMHDFLFALDLHTKCIPRWVKGHLKVKGNERADELSKEAAYQGAAYYREL